MKKIIFLIIILSLLTGVIFVFLFFKTEPKRQVETKVKKELPLLKYSISHLPDYPYQASEIKLEAVIATQSAYTSYLFSYQTTGRTMTGQANIPISEAKGTIVMLRGYISPENYQSGDGTRAAAAVFANNGYVTLAPDFLGFGGSDPEPSDSWEARFIKPVNVIELLKSVSTLSIHGEGTPANAGEGEARLGIWAHSNGGQIALTVLEVLDQSIPTTLWAPVTSPFPYSVLYFTDEMEDEGKATRKWLSQFEKDYDVFDFSLSKHLDKLSLSPIQIHQGTSDDAVLVWQTREFIDKTETASSSAINVQYFEYPDTDHNMKPSWDLAVQRDLEFFANNLAN